MKKCSLAFLGLFITSFAFSQTDTALQGRLNRFLQVNDEMDLNKVLDYTYGKLFTLVPRDQMLTLMQSTYDNDQMTIRLDSLKIDSIFPVFILQNARYAKVRYAMTMNMLMKEKKGTAAQQQEMNNRLQEILGLKYGQNNVFVNDSGDVRIYLVTDMLAVQDEFAKEWSFINILKDDPMLEMLISKEVIEKLATYQ